AEVLVQILTFRNSAHGFRWRSDEDLQSQFVTKFTLRSTSSTVSIPKLGVGQSFCVGAALCGRPPPGNHIGLPLRLLQRFLAMSGCRSEFFCCLPLCTNLA